MDDENTTAAELERLRVSFQNFTGCTAEEAEQTFAVTLVGWGMRPDQLPDVLRKLVIPELGMHTNPVLLWLYSHVQMARTSAGRKMMLMAAEKMARIEKASWPPDDETRH
jgi:hypothetical protein